MASLPNRADISGTPDNATANAGMGSLWDYLSGLFGTDGAAATARSTLGAGAVGDTLFTASTVAVVKSLVPIQSGTSVATTSGTAIDFTGIPSWAKRITVMFSGVSTNGTDNWLIQIGDSGGVETSGYLGTAGGFDNSGAAATAFTTGFGVRVASAASVVHGSAVLTLLNGATNTWAASGTFGLSNVVFQLTTAGSKSLTATLDRVRITTTGGTNTFDAGLINIIYE